MGAGHDGAAKGLAAQLRAGDHEAEIRDFLDSGPLRVGAALRSGYEFELKHIPGAYDATYRMWYRLPWLCPVVAWIVTLLCRRRVLRWVNQSNASVVVSTYPLATLCLGRLRSKGKLRVPAINFITDFGVHPLWVHRGMDLNLAVHEGAARMAAERTGRPAVACGPVVSPSFDPGRLPGRAEARQQTGLAADDRAVLVVAGSWGVGDLEATWEAIAGDGRYTPVFVCGRDDRLRERVAALADRYDGHSVVVGWTDQMPSLMAACDALVENAGGLTSLEAMRAGLPVVSFHPIAGHGRENTTRMAAAGVSRLASDPGSLGRALAAITVPGPDRDAQVSRGQAMFRTEPAGLVAQAAAVGPVIPMRRPASVRVGVKIAAACVAISALGWAGLTSGVAMATDAGAGVAHPVKGADTVAYIGVRVSGAEMSNVRVVNELRSMNVTAVVDSSTAAGNVSAVRHLVSVGINVENGGLGDSSDGTRHDSDQSPWTRAKGDAAAGYRLGLLIDRPVTLTMPGRRLNVWDLVDCKDAHLTLVVPNHILDASHIPGDVVHLSPRRIYLINGLAATPAELAGFLSQVEAGLQAAHLTGAPLVTLA
jgi:processive 1,2-diacylglycerol beta-glucosyltransferase